VYTVIIGSNTSVSFRLEARTNTMPGMPEFLEYTGDPQIGQKPRLTLLPLSAGEL